MAKYTTFCANKVPRVSKSDAKNLFKSTATVMSRRSPLIWWDFGPTPKAIRNTSYPGQAHAFYGGVNERLKF